MSELAGILYMLAPSVAFIVGTIATWWIGWELCKSVMNRSVDAVLHDVTDVNVVVLDVGVEVKERAKAA